MSRILSFPFAPAWREKMLQGQKICTSRTRPCGQPGDTFFQFGQEFTLTRVEQQPLEFVAVQLYEAEGCRSPREFMAIWRDLHPRRGWDPDQVVFVHHFQKGAPVAAGTSART